jgi:hypothetical protein
LSFTWSVIYQVVFHLVSSSSGCLSPGQLFIRLSFTWSAHHQTGFHLVSSLSDWLSTGQLFQVNADEQGDMRKRQSLKQLRRRNNVNVNLSIFVAYQPRVKESLKAKLTLSLCSL